MEHEIDLPPMPVSQDDPPSEPSELHSRRKRPRLEYELTTSSEPALFSSDDHAPTAESYAAERRKNEWAGTWWGEKYTGHDVRTSAQGTRQLTRNLDSGIWMGSDATDTSLADELLEELRPIDKQASALTCPSGGAQKGLGRLGNDASIVENVDEDKIHRDQPQQEVPETQHDSPLYAAVEEIVESCLDAGNENVDLSSMSLDEVPNKSLRRLRSLTKHTRIQDIPPSQEAYAPLEAELRLYLSNNSISRLPSELLNLTSLRVLSVRHNNLTDIPPALARLPRLEQLNIAGNRLNYLPYEMLRLYDRAGFKMIATPNPFQRPASATSAIPPRTDLQLSVPLLPLLLARSSPTYVHVVGSKSGGNSSTSLPPSRTTPVDAVPSLFELALQKCKFLPNLSETRAWCTSGAGPETLSWPLSLAQDAAEYGNLECTNTACRRSFIIPRVLWTEWWILPSGSGGKDTQRAACTRADACDIIIPFLRMGCSRRCGEDEISSSCLFS